MKALQMIQARVALESNGIDWDADSFTLRGLKFVFVDQPHVLYSTTAVNSAKVVIRYPLLRELTEYAMEDDGIIISILKVRLNHNMTSNMLSNDVVLTKTGGLQTVSKTELLHALASILPVLKRMQRGRGA